MHYLDFNEKLSPFVVFSLRDAEAIDPGFNPVQLSQWKKKGLITKLTKGNYIFSNQVINENILFLIANELLEPSYVSLESALSYYGLIPEGVYSTTSVSTVRTTTYDTTKGTFMFRKIKNSAFFGYKTVEIENSERSFKIATVEKAIIDYLYFRNDLSDEASISSIRLNQDILETEVDTQLLSEYSSLMSNSRLEKVVDKLINYYFV